jgi:peptide-methionine (S)-S-oxide reductase
MRSVSWVLLLIITVIIGCDDRDALVMVEKADLPGDCDMSYDKAMFGAGCFWGVEAKFRAVEGVVDAAVGYSGGEMEAPGYKDVCSGRTGHAEVVEVVFDPAVVSYEGLLEVFWGMHNPTTRNRQGPDVGSQYRSVVFYETEEQGAVARAFKAKLEDSGKFTGEIVTEIKPAGTFWRAEEYHQRYLEKKGP